MVKNQRNSCCHMGCPPMFVNLHFHRGYSLGPQKSKPLIIYGIVSTIGRWRPLALRCELYHSAMNGSNGWTRFAQRHALDHLHEFRRELSISCIGSFGSYQASQPGGAVSGQPTLHGAEWDTGIACS